MAVPKPSGWYVWLVEHKVNFDIWPNDDPAVADQLSVAWAGFALDLLNGGKDIDAKLAPIVAAWGDSLGQQYHDNGKTLPPHYETLAGAANQLSTMTKEYANNIRMAQNEIKSELIQGAIEAGFWLLVPGGWSRVLGRAIQSGAKIAQIISKFSRFTNALGKLPKLALKTGKQLGQEVLDEVSTDLIRQKLNINDGLQDGVHWNETAKAGAAGAVGVPGNAATRAVTNKAGEGVRKLTGASDKMIPDNVVTRAVSSGAHNAVVSPVSGQFVENASKGDIFGGGYGEALKQGAFNSAVIGGGRAGVSDLSQMGGDKLWGTPDTITEQAGVPPASAPSASGTPPTPPSAAAPDAGGVGAPGDPGTGQTGAPTGNQVGAGGQTGAPTGDAGGTGGTSSGGPSGGTGGAGDQGGSTAPTGGAGAGAGGHGGSSNIGPGNATNAPSNSDGSEFGGAPGADDTGGTSTGDTGQPGQQGQTGATDSGQGGTAQSDGQGGAVQTGPGGDGGATGNPGSGADGSGQSNADSGTGGAADGSGTGSDDTTAPTGGGGAFAPAGGAAAAGAGAAAVTSGATNSGPTHTTLQGGQTGPPGGPPQSAQPNQSAQTGSGGRTSSSAPSGPAGDQNAETRTGPPGGKPNRGGAQQNSANSDQNTAPDAPTEPTARTGPELAQQGSDAATQPAGPAAAQAAPDPSGTESAEASTAPADQKPGKPARTAPGQSAGGRTGSTAPDTAQDTDANDTTEPANDGPKDPPQDPPDTAESTPDPNDGGRPQPDTNPTPPQQDAHGLGRFDESRLTRNPANGKIVLIDGVPAEQKLRQLTEARAKELQRAQQAANEELAARDQAANQLRQEISEATDAETRQQKEQELSELLDRPLTKQAAHRDQTGDTLALQLNLKTGEVFEATNGPRSPDTPWNANEEITRRITELRAERAAAATRGVLRHVLRNGGLPPGTEVSAKELARKLRLPEKNVAKALHELAEAGEVVATGDNTYLVPESTQDSATPDEQQQASAERQRLMDEALAAHDEAVANQDQDPSADDVLTAEADVDQTGSDNGPPDDAGRNDAADQSGEPEYRQPDARPAIPPSRERASMGRFDESRLTRDADTGRITHVDGVPVREKLGELAKDRAEQFRNAMEDGRTATKEQAEIYRQFMTAETGNVLALVIDTMTGEVFEAVNGPTDSYLTLGETHTKILLRASELAANYDGRTPAELLPAKAMDRAVETFGRRLQKLANAHAARQPGVLADGRELSATEHELLNNVAAAYPELAPALRGTLAEQQAFAEAVDAYLETFAKDAFPGFDEPMRHAEVRAANAALWANPNAELADVIADVWQMNDRPLLNEDGTKVRDENGRVVKEPGPQRKEFCPNCSGILHDVLSNSGPDEHNARILGDQNPDDSGDTGPTSPTPPPNPTDPNQPSGGAAANPETTQETGTTETSDQNAGPAAIDAGGTSTTDQNAGDQDSTSTQPTRTSSHGDPNATTQPIQRTEETTQDPNDDVTTPTKPTRTVSHGDPTTSAAEATTQPTRRAETTTQPVNRDPNGNDPTTPVRPGNGDPNATTQPIRPPTPTPPDPSGTGPTRPVRRPSTPPTPPDPTSSLPTRPVRRPSTPPTPPAPPNNSGTSTGPTRPIRRQPTPPAGTVPSGQTSTTQNHSNQNRPNQNPPAPTGRIVNGERGAVPSVPHSTFFARVGGNALMRNVVQALAHAAMTRTAKRADANGINPYVVAKDAGLDVTAITPKGNGTFEITQRDGTRITATIDVGPTSNGNLAEFIVDTRTNTATILMSPNVAKEHIERTLGNAFAQINQLIRGNTNRTDLLTDTKHPGDDFTPSHRDHGRQGELRNLDRTRAETSRLRLARRRQLTKEMAALVEHLGLHPDQNGALDRAALLDGDAAGVISRHIGVRPREEDKRTARRPSWVEKDPTGLPTWGAYKHELVVQGLPGLFASGAIIGTSIAFAGPAGPFTGIMAGLGVGVVSVGSAVSGTLIKKWTAARDKKVGDTYMEHVAEKTKYAANQRDKKLLDTLLERSWSANPDPSNVPQEHKPGEAPPRTPTVGKLAINRALPQWIGVALAVGLLPFGLPPLALAAQAGVALINTVGGPFAERYLRRGNLGRDAAMEDGVTRNLADLAHNNQVAKIRLLHAFLDRLDALAGHTPTGQRPDRGPALPTDDGKTILRRFFADNAGGNLFNNAVGGLGDFARGLEDIFFKNKDGAVELVTLRWVVGMLGFSFLDSRFRDNELLAVFEQLFFDKASEHLDQQARLDAMFDTFMERLDQHISAAEQQAGSNQRVQQTGQSRAVDLRRGMQPAPDHTEAGPKNVPQRRVDNDTELAQSLPAKRPTSMQRVRAFWANSIMKNTVMAGAMAYGSYQFLDNPLFSFNDQWGGVFVVGSAAFGGILATWSAVKFRQAQERAGEQEATFNEAKNRATAEAKAKRQGRYLEEFLAREDAARNDPAERNKPMPRYPAPVRQNDSRFPGYVKDWVAVERARMELEPRPYGIYDARRQGLDRIEKLADRLEKAAEYRDRTGNARPFNRARVKLNQLRNEYAELVREGTDMSEDDEAAKPVDPGPPPLGPGQNPGPPNPPPGDPNAGPPSGPNTGPTRPIPRPVRRSGGPAGANPNGPTTPITRPNPNTGPTTPITRSNPDTDPTIPVRRPDPAAGPTQPIPQTGADPNATTQPTPRPDNTTTQPTRPANPNAQPDPEATTEPTHRPDNATTQPTNPNAQPDPEATTEPTHRPDNATTQPTNPNAQPESEATTQPTRPADPNATGPTRPVRGPDETATEPVVPAAVDPDATTQPAQPTRVDPDATTRPTNRPPRPVRRKSGRPPADPGAGPSTSQTRSAPEHADPTAAAPDPAEKPVPYTESGVRPQLDERLQRLWNHGVDTQGGRAYFGEDEVLNREQALRLPAEEGMYTFDAHGAPDTVFIGEETLTVEDVARLIEADPRFTGQAVWLFACHTGRNHDGFAQQLADRLGVEVVAPSHMAGAMNDGQTYVTDRVYDQDGNDVGLAWPAVGYWSSFQPIDPNDPSTFLPAPSEHVARIEAREAAQPIHNWAPTDGFTRDTESSPQNPVPFTESGVRPQLDERLQRIYDEAGFDTRGGRAYFDPDETDAYDSAQVVPFEEGMYTFDAHGSPHEVYVGDEVLSVEDVALLIEADPYFVGQAIWLFSCETGQDPNGFAQQLANRLGVEVIAPNMDTGVMPDGQTYVTEHELDEEGNPTGIVYLPATGSWRSFRPIDPANPTAAPAPSELLARIEAREAAQDINDPDYLNDDPTAFERGTSRHPQPQLNPRLRAIFDAGYDIPGGRAYFTQDDLDLHDPERATPLDIDQYVVSTSGAADSVRVGTETLSVEDLALLIEADFRYNGQDILLVADATGDRSDGFAQQLADRLGVEVIAPDALGQWRFFRPADAAADTPAGDPAPDPDAATPDETIPYTESGLRPRLDERLRRIWDAGVDVREGHAYFTADEGALRDDIPPVPAGHDMYTFAAHAAPDGLRAGEDLLSVEDAAILIESDPRFLGQPVLLFTPGTPVSNEFAEQLMLRLGADVAVPITVTQAAESAPDQDDTASRPPLDERLQQIWDLGIDVAGGRIYYADHDLHRVDLDDLVPLHDNQYVVGALGTATSAVVDTETLSADDLARLIEADFRYRGQEICLFVDGARAAADGLAKQLADRLGVKVWANNGMSWGYVQPANSSQSAQALRFFRSQPHWVDEDVEDVAASTPEPPPRPFAESGVRPRLDERLQGIWDQGSDVPGGRVYLTPEDAKRYEPTRNPLDRDDLYSFFADARTRDVWFDSQPLSVEDVALLIEADPNFTGQAVALDAPGVSGLDTVGITEGDHLATDGPSFAQRLAYRLGVEVLAPSFFGGTWKSYLPTGPEESPAEDYDGGPVPFVESGERPELDDRLDEIFHDIGVETGGGRAYYGPDDVLHQATAHAIPVFGDLYTFDALGSLDAVYVGDQALSVEDVALLIEADPYFEGQAVWLFACNTGEELAPEGFAQQLADRLGVMVIAPSGLAAVTPDGRTFVTSGLDGYGNARPPDGEWRAFYPRDGAFLEEHLEDGPARLARIQQREAAQLPDFHTAEEAGEYYVRQAQEAVFRDHPPDAPAETDHFPFDPRRLPAGVWIGEESPSVEDVATLIEADPNYTGQAVRLRPFDSEPDPDGFASRLADRLGTDVDLDTDDVSMASRRTDKTYDPAAFDHPAPYARTGYRPLLNERLQRIFDAGVDTPGGRAYHAPDDVTNAAHAAAIPGVEGMYVFDAHGDTDAVFVGTERLTVEDVAQLIEADPNYTGQAIWLFACYTGHDKDGFAQQLAYRLGVHVVAPSHLAASTPDGQTLVTTKTQVQDEDGNVTEVHVLPPSGFWREFPPDPPTEGKTRFGYFAQHAHKISRRESAQPIHNYTEEQIAAHYDSAKAAAKATAARDAGDRKPFVETGVRPTLDPRLKRLWRTGIRTDGGRSYYDNRQDRAGARAIPAKKGMYRFEAHGAEDHVQLGDEDLSVEDVATLIEADPRFTGQPVWLLSCSTGRLRDGFAAQLAKRLGVEVIAPSNVVVTSRTGEVRVIDPATALDENGNVIGDRHGGGWISYPADGSTPQWGWSSKKFHLMPAREAAKRLRSFGDDQRADTESTRDDVAQKFFPRNEPEAQPQLDERLVAVWETGVDTPSGRAYFSQDDTAFLRSALAAPAQDDVYTFDAHAIPDALRAGRELLTVADAAALIEADPKYTGQAVHLPSFKIGSKFAAQLAERLGVDVTTGETLDSAAEPATPREPFASTGVRPTIGARVRRLWDAGIPVPGGRAYFSVAAHRIAALGFPGKLGMYKFEAHGTPLDALFDDGTMSVEDVATLIEADPNFTGQPVWLLSCSTGQLRDGFAQRLATRLGVEVIAPTDLAVMTRRDNVYVIDSAEALDENGNIDRGHIRHAGYWVAFQPDGSTPLGWSSEYFNQLREYETGQPIPVFDDQSTVPDTGAVRGLDTRADNADTAPSTQDELAPYTRTGVRPQLDERLQRVFDAGMATVGGRAYQDTEFASEYPDAVNFPAEPGMYTFDAHASADAVYLGDERLSVEDVARLIEADPNFTGQAVWLFCCFTGRDAGGFAQQLADRLGVEVVAPSALAVTTPEGETLVTERAVDADGNVTDIPALPPNGFWRSFQPGATQPTWSEHSRRIGQREARQHIHSLTDQEVAEYYADEGIKPAARAASQPARFVDTGVRPELGPHQEIYWRLRIPYRNGGAYFAGNDYDDRDRAGELRDNPRLYTFRANGFTDGRQLGSVRFGSGRMVTSDVAALIEADPNFTGEPVWLVASNTGRGDTGVARILAARLGVEVIAPNGRVEVTPDGEVVVMDETGTRLEGTDAWTSFRPDGSTAPADPAPSADRTTEPDHPASDAVEAARPPLPERLRRLWDDSIAHASGRAFFAPHEHAARALARTLPHEPDLYTVQADSKVAGKLSVGEVELSVEDTALLIEADPRFTGQPVWLVAPDTGRGRTKTFASKLAARLGTEVVAPSGRVVHAPDGTLLVTDKLWRVTEDGNHVRDYALPPMGNWSSFLPDGSESPQGSAPAAARLLAHEAQRTVPDYTHQQIAEHYANAGVQPGARGPFVATGVRPRLSERLRRLWNEGFELLGGRGYFAEHERAHWESLRTPYEPYMYTFQAHGSTRGVHFDGEVLSVEDVATLIEADPNFTGQPVWLVSCRTGRLPDGFASELAIRLGVEVVAPTGITVITADGQVYVTDKTVALDENGNVTEVAVVPPTRFWMSFRPDGTVSTESRQITRLREREARQRVHNLDADGVAEHHRRRGIRPLDANESAGEQQSGSRIRPRDHVAAERWAREAYDRFRRDDSDVADLAANLADVPRADGRTGFSEAEIAQVKQHVFHDEHPLTDYENGGYTRARFDPDPDMAEAWIRLREGRQLPADLVLFEHELAESGYLREHPEASYAEAHRHANENHNWEQITPSRTGEDLDVSWGATHGDSGVLREDRGDGPDGGVRLRRDTGVAGPADDGGQGGHGRQSGGRDAQPPVPGRAAEDPGTAGRRGDVAGEGDARVLAGPSRQDGVAARPTDAVEQPARFVETGVRPELPERLRHLWNDGIEISARPRLADLLRRLWNHDTDTGAGRAYFAPHEHTNRALASALQPASGLYTFHSNGTSNSASAGKEKLTVEDVALLIEADPDFTGQPVRLAASETGSNHRGFAQQLATRLGVEVVAPTSLVVHTPDGQLMVTEKGFREDENGNLTEDFVLPPNRGWEAFLPNKAGLPGGVAPEVVRYIQQQERQSFPYTHAQIVELYAEAGARPDAAGVFVQTGIRPTLSDRLQRFWDDSVELPGGRAYFTRRDVAMREAPIPYMPHLYTFSAHGSPDAAHIGDEDLSVEDVATLIEADPRFTGQPVWLFACGTGREAAGFASKLAQRLGVEVVAPSGLAVVTPDGEVFVTTERWAQDEYGNRGTAIVLPPAGYWKSFLPDGSVGRHGSSPHVARLVEREAGQRMNNLTDEEIEDFYQRQGMRPFGGNDPARGDQPPSWRDEIAGHFSAEEVARLDAALDKSSQSPTPGQVPGSGQLTQAERELIAKAHERIEITPDTPMQKVLGPGVEQLYAANQEPHAYSQFDANQVGGYVARIADNAHLRTPVEILRANRLDYDTRFDGQPLYVMEFIAGDAAAYKIPFGAPFGDGSGLGANDRAVRDASAAMLEAARTAGLDPASYEQRDQAWPNTGTGWTASGADGVPERIRPYVDVPPGSTIYRIDVDGTRTPFLTYHGRDLGGWQAPSTVDDSAVRLRAAEQDGTEEWLDLNPQLQPFADASRRVPGGRAFYAADDEAMYADAQLVPELPGVYRIDIHAQDDIAIIDDVVLRAKHLAQLIEADPYWTGEPIWLFACNAGANAHGFAQQLANLLGVEVVAADGWVGATPDGNTFVAKSVHRTAEGILIPDGPADGTWKSFRPNDPDGVGGYSHLVARIEQREAGLDGLDTGTHDLPPRLRGTGTPTSPPPGRPRHRPIGLIYEDEDDELPALVLPPDIEAPPHVVVPPPSPRPDDRPDGGDDRPRPDAPDRPDTSGDADQGGGGQDQPGGDQPGGDQPGGEQPGGEEPGGEEPGQDQPGEQPGGDDGTDEPCPDENVPPPGETPIYVGDERLWPDELADLIAASEEWRGGPIRLLVPHGELTEDFLRRLADLLGVAILVPAESVVDGFPRCSSGTLMVYNEAEPVIPPDGEWRVFEPRTAPATSMKESP